MSELMALGQALTMSSREIAELTGKEHFHVMRDIREMLAALAEDESKFGGIYLDAYSREQACFNLPKDLTITLVAGYNVQMRHAIVKRWQELEATQAKPTELSRMDILKLAMESEQARIDAEHKLALAAPKVAFVDKYVQATGLFTFREVAKLLKANEARFREFLIDSKVMYYLGKKLTAYKNHEDAGRFAVKTDTAKNGRDYRQTFFTPKGVHWVAGQWAKHQEREAASASGN